MIVGGGEERDAGFGCGPPLPPPSAFVVALLFGPSMPGDDPVVGVGGEGDDG